MGFCSLLHSIEKNRKFVSLRACEAAGIEKKAGDGDVLNAPMKAEKRTTREISSQPTYWELDAPKLIPGIRKCR